MTSTWVAFTEVDTKSIQRQTEVKAQPYHISELSLADGKAKIKAN